MDEKILKSISIINRYMSKRSNPWLCLIPVAMGVFMCVLDMSVLNVALPVITQEFGASASDVQWLLTAYLITFVVLLTTFGRIGDMVQRNLLYTAGMAIFAFGSYLCATSWNIGVFILFRIFQAIGGAIMMGNSMALITELFPPGQRGMAMGVQSILIASSFALGPVVGGWITTHLSWHWIFYINIPIGLLGITLGLILLPPLGQKVKEPIDVIGLILLAIGLGSFTLGVIKGQDWGWDSEKTLACFIIAISYLIAFAMREITFEHPLLDLRLFKIRNFVVGIVGLFFVSMGLSASIFLLPFFLEGIKGLNAEECGIWLLPLPLINIFTAPLAGRLSDRINPKITMCVGPVMFATGLFLLSKVEVDVTYWELAPIFVVLGSGMGLLMPAAMNVMMSSVPAEKAGMASGTIQTSNSLARAMGVTVGGVLFTGKLNEIIPNFGNRMPNPMELQFLAMFGKPSAYVAVVEAFMESFHHVFLGVEPFIIFSFCVILLFLRGEEHLRRVRRAKAMAIAT